MKSIRVGDPLDKNTDLGAINSKEQYETISRLVKVGQEEGYDYFEANSSKLPEKGYYLNPSFFNRVAQSATVNREEIFGPVLTISSFRSPGEAVDKANDTRFGLAAGLWTEKPSKVHWLSERLNAGVVWTNTYNKFDPSSAFGGFLESGFGREGGVEGLRSYLKG